MIQRIQTVYLVLAAVSISLILFFPICYYQLGEIEYTLTIKNLLGTDDTVEPVIWGIGLLILAPLALFSVIYMISQYKNRQRQLSIGRVTYLLLAAIIAISMFVIEKNEPEGAQLSGYWLGYFAPVAALPFVFLANRSIKKDEDLVKALDRLR